MLPCSVRRIASAAPQSPTTFLSNFASAIPRAAGAVSLAYRPNIQQRRRYSSSKPSRDNGSEDPPVRQSAKPSAAESKTTEIKAAGTKPVRKRKAKEASLVDASLPSVPSTQHIPQSSLCLSTFFSLHRPISVTNIGVPYIINDDIFASMFAPRPKEAAPHPLSIISKAVDSLESTISSTTETVDSKLDTMELRARQQEKSNRMDQLMKKLELHQSDGRETSIDVQINAMSGQFSPFSLPPLPQPEPANAAAEVSETSVEEMSLDEPHTRVYKAIFTIEESTDAEGHVKILAHSPELIEEHQESTEPEARSWVERMALRQLKHEDRMRYRRGPNTMMYLISVKRQRKLKMKKKKYKKLMKRTRNLRRKLERT